MRIVTWNMQGSKTSGLKTPDGARLSKWDTDIKAIFQQAAPPIDMMLLQEAGEPPANVSIAMPPAWTPSAQAPAGVPWGFFSWNIGSPFRPRTLNIFWIKADFASTRNNLAIAWDPATVTVSALFFVQNPAEGKPAIGVNATFKSLTGNTQCNIFNLLAYPGNGTDAPGLVAAADKASASLPWFIAGAFNCPADSFSIPTGASFCPWNMSPSMSGSQQTDYAINSAGAITGQSLMESIGYEHVPIEYTC